MNLADDMREWRRALHAAPEFGFDLLRTAGFVAEKLRSFGLDEVVEGVGGCGVVGTLKRGRSARAVALRADMDALRITERSDAPWVSRREGLMHACGHDGHISMLLGAARRLAQEGGFDGVARFIFQPAEEWGKGARAMLEDGLTTRFPFEEIYALHSMPGLPVGVFSTRPGPIMAAEDNFEIALKGVGGHASAPHIGREAMVAACCLVTQLQTIVARRIDPTQTAVVSVTEILTDGTRNALPSRARILGDARSFDGEISAAIERDMRSLAQGVATGFGLDVEVSYTREFIPTLNDPALTGEALAAARATLGEARVVLAPRPIAASEDFAQFLASVPGCYGFIGNGEASAPLHHPSYDFNDDALEAGACVHVEIVRRRLAPRQELSA